MSIEHSTPFEFHKSEITTAVGCKRRFAKLTADKTSQFDGMEVLRTAPLIFEPEKNRSSRNGCSRVNTLAVGAMR